MDNQNNIEWEHAVEIDMPEAVRQFLKGGDISYYEKAQESLMPIREWLRDSCCGRFSLIPGHPLVYFSEIDDAVAFRFEWGK